MSFDSTIPLCCTFDAAKSVKTLVVILTGTFLSWFVVGCASSGAVRSVDGGVNSRIASQDTVVVEVVSEVPGSESEQKLLQALIASGLQQSDRFRRVVGSAPQQDPEQYLKVTARISDLNGVSDGARIFVGALAGQASIVVDVELKEALYDVPNGAFQAVGKSSAGWAGAGTTNQAVQRAAEQIVAEILRRL